LQKWAFIITLQGAAGGTFVTELAFDNLVNSFLDLFLSNRITFSCPYQVRVLIEPEVARLAASHVTADYAERIRDCLKAEEQVITSVARDIELKSVFHYLLAEMCGNRFVAAIVASAMRSIRRVLIVTEAVPAIVHPHPAGMHLPVAEAVLAGDGEAAASAMRLHAIEFGTNLASTEKTYREKNRSEK